MGSIAGIILLLPLAAAVYLLIRLIVREVWKRHLKIRISYKKRAVYAGEESEIVVRAKNDRRLPVPQLNFSVHLPDGLRSDEENPHYLTGTVKRDSRAAAGGRLKMKRTFKVTGVRRGQYKICEAAFRSASVWRLFFCRKISEEEEILYVYAARTDVSGILELTEDVAHDMEMRKRLAYSAPASPYTDMGPQNAGSAGGSAAGAFFADNISENGSAGSDLERLFKGQGIIARMYSSVHDYQVQIFLDVESFDFKEESPLIEDSIASAATLASELMMKGIATGLLINAGMGTGQQSLIFSPGTGDDKLLEIEQALTMDFSDVMASDFVSLTMHLSENQLPVFISKNADQGRADDMAENLAPGCGGILVIPCRKGTLKKVHGTGNLRVMYREIE